MCRGMEVWRYGGVAKLKLYFYSSSPQKGLTKKRFSPLIIVIFDIMKEAK